MLNRIMTASWDTVYKTVWHDITSSSNCCQHGPSWTGFTTYSTGKTFQTKHSSASSDTANYQECRPVSPLPYVIIVHQFGLIVKMNMLLFRWTCDSCLAWSWPQISVNLQEIRSRAFFAWSMHQIDTGRSPVWKNGSLWEEDSNICLFNTKMLLKYKPKSTGGKGSLAMRMREDNIQHHL